MGLLVNVYTSVCNRRDASRWTAELTVMNAEGHWEPTPEAPAVVLVSGYNGPSTTELAIIVPAVYDADAGEWKEAPGGYIWDGAFAYSCDSRFAQAIRRMTGRSSNSAIRFHDRPWTKWSG